MRIFIAVLAFTMAGLIVVGTDSAQSAGDVAITLGADDGSSTLKVKNNSGTEKVTVTDTGVLWFADGTSQSGAGVTFDNSVSSMRLVRGMVEGGGVKLAGEGFTSASPPSTIGIVEVTFAPAFSSTPICTCSVVISPPDVVYTCSVGVYSNGKQSFFTGRYCEDSGQCAIGFDLHDVDFSFICVGP